MCLPEIEVVYGALRDSDEDVADDLALVLRRQRMAEQRRVTCAPATVAQHRAALPELFTRLPHFTLIAQVHKYRHSQIYINSAKWLLNCKVLNSEFFTLNSSFLS